MAVGVLATLGYRDSQRAGVGEVPHSPPSGAGPAWAGAAGGLSSPSSVPESPVVSITGQLSGKAL